MREAQKVVILQWRTSSCKISHMEQICFTTTESSKLSQKTEVMLKLVIKSFFTASKMLICEWGMMKENVPVDTKVLQKILINFHKP